MNLIEEQSKSLLEAIANGEAPFAYIPEEIGDLRFCYANNMKKDPYTKEEKRKKLLYWIGCSIIVPIVCWIVFNNSPIFDTIISIIALIVIIKTIINISNFKGTDYFVGNKGFAVVSFNGKRDNIVTKSIHFYDEFSELITGETVKKQNGAYIGTDYFFGFFSKPISTENNSSKVNLVLDEGGTHNQQKEKDDQINDHYTFWKNIEDVWTSIKLSELLESPNRQSVTFSILHSPKNSNDWYATPYVTISPNSITVGGVNGRVYDKNTLKNLWFENGELVIEHINHSKKMFGLIEKGDIEHIPLTNIGNKKLFMLYLQSVIKF